MQKLLRLMVLAGLFALAFWTPGQAPSAQAATCPGGYPSCTFLGNRACSTSTYCCYGYDLGYCSCGGGHYKCAF